MRIAVQLYYFQGYSLQEIADFLGTSVSVLKKRLFDARRKLKGALPVADVLSVFNHLYEGGKAVLHIVNGDVVGEKLRQGIVKGDVLVWREVYSHELRYFWILPMEITALFERNIWNKRWGFRRGNLSPIVRGKRRF